MTRIVATFRELHRQSTPLILPNAWDAASARVFESLGARAIATTSAGVAWALGYQDGRGLPFEEALGAARRMARVLTVPLSIDIEHGYAEDPKIVADNVLRLADLGVAGINLEDGTDPASVLAAKIEAIRNALAKAGADLYVNARTDVFLANLVEPAKLVDESIQRGKLYASAGADGLFLPGVSKPVDIEAVAGAVNVPLNVMAWPGLADAEALGKLGVRRLSAGSSIAQVLLGAARQLGQDFLQTGSSAPKLDTFMNYAELQALFPAGR